MWKGVYRAVSWLDCWKHQPRSLQNQVCYNRYDRQLLCFLELVHALIAKWYNLFNAEATFVQNSPNPSKPCHVGIHWIDVAVYSQISTHLPGFQSSCLDCLHHLLLAKLATSSMRAKALPLTAHCHAPLPGPGHVRKFPVTLELCGVFTRHSGFLHLLN